MEKTAKNYAIWFVLKSDINFFTNGPSYYGGVARSQNQFDAYTNFCLANGMHQPTPRNVLVYGKKTVLDAIYVIGIDWDKSSTPKSKRCSEFDGTDNDSTYIDVMTGELVLLDGTHIDYYADCSIDLEQVESVMSFSEFFSS